MRRDDTPALRQAVRVHADHVVPGPEAGLDQHFGEQADALAADAAKVDVHAAHFAATSVLARMIACSGQTWMQLPLPLHRS